MMPPGRNSPCPCGSGKRYKDCHGAFAQTADSPPLDDAIRRELDAALAAQKAGRYAEAIALYEAVVEREPRNFDALHMLGVAHYQVNDFPRAYEKVRAALSIMPNDAGARVNLELIEAALEYRTIEPEVCVEALPRLRKRCIASPLGGDRRRWQGMEVDVIVSKSKLRDGGIELQRFIDWLAATVTLWQYPQPSPLDSSLSLRRIDPERAELPEQRAAIFYGADISPATWYPRSLAMDVALYCDAYDACTLIDRIPELAREGRTPIRLLFASAALAQRTGLPGWAVDPSDTGR
jgi:tetratricopeptide (TPR) repeat protein